MNQRLILFCSLILSLQLSRAQNTEADYRSIIQSNFSGLDLENKLLFVSVWQSGDIDSRMNNKEFVRVSDIYKQAKLKGGSKGVCYINICLDKSVSLWEISMKRDSIAVTDRCFVNNSDKYEDLLKEFESKPGNVVVNNSGEVIKTGLTKETCFKFFNSLISR